MWSDHTFLESCTYGLSFGTKVCFISFLLIELLFDLVQILFDSKHIIQEMFVLPIYILSAHSIIETFMFNHERMTCSMDSFLCCSQSWFMLSSIQGVKAITMIFSRILVYTTIRIGEKWLGTRYFLTVRTCSLIITVFRWDLRGHWGLVLSNKRRFLTSYDLLNDFIWYHGLMLYAVDKAESVERRFKVLHIDIDSSALACGWGLRFLSLWYGEWVRVEGQYSLIFHQYLLCLLTNR